MGDHIITEQGLVCHLETDYLVDQNLSSIQTMFLDMRMVTPNISLVEWNKRTSRWTVRHHIEKVELEGLNMVFVDLKQQFKKFLWETRADSSLSRKHHQQSL